MAIGHLGKPDTRKESDNVGICTNQCEMVYFKINLSKINKPITNEVNKTRWKIKLNENWEDSMWVNLNQKVFQTTPVVRQRYFQFKNQHKILTTNLSVSKWNKDVTLVCTFCQGQREAILHLLVECKYAKRIWKWPPTILNFQKFQHLTAEQIIFNSYDGADNKIINTLILVLKYFIYAARSKGVKQSLQNALVRIVHFKNTEKFIANRNNTMLKFERKWNKKSNRLFICLILTR